MSLPPPICPDCETPLRRIVPVYGYVYKSPDPSTFNKWAATIVLSGTTWHDSREKAQQTVDEICHQRGPAWALASGPEGVQRHRINHDPPPPFAHKTIVRKFLVQMSFPETAEICACDNCQAMYSKALLVWIHDTLMLKINVHDPLRIFPEKIVVETMEEP